MPMAKQDPAIDKQMEYPTEWTIVHSDENAVPWEEEIGEEYQANEEIGVAGCPASPDSSRTHGDVR